MNGGLHIAASEPIIDTIVTQHAEETSFLWVQRGAAVRSPHFSLRHLARQDERVAAHIDGLRVAGEAGLRACEAQSVPQEPGAVFAAMVLALEIKHLARIERIFSLAEALPPMQAGLISAFGWVSSQFLQGTVKELLAARSAFHRRVGVACCAMHGIYPGRPLDVAIDDADPELRERALRAAGELSRRDLLSLCQQRLRDEDTTCRFGAAWSSVLLGDRREAVEALKVFSLFPGFLQEQALQLGLKVMALHDAHALLKALAQETPNLRAVIQGTAVVGDPFYVPWLIKQMNDGKTARLAGESFSLITGLDLAYLDLDRKPPEDFEPGPNDNPDDSDVSMDPDDSLPWPDPAKIQAWWDTNKSRFTEGVRYFMGAHVTREHCIHVLKEGYQRQRIAAAQYLCLLQPGTQLFPTSAPAWRQQRWLSKMG